MWWKCLIIFTRWKFTTKMCLFSSLASHQHSRHYFSSEVYIVRYLRNGQLKSSLMWGNGFLKYQYFSWCRTCRFSTSGSSTLDLKATPSSNFYQTVNQKGACRRSQKKEPLNHHSDLCPASENTVSNSND